MSRKPILILEPDAIEWRPFHEVFPGEEQKGKWVRVLNEDDDTRAFTGLIRFEKGWSDQRSVYHKCTEEVFIIRGKFKIGDRIMGEGAYAYRPPLTLHAGAEALEETIMYIAFDGDGAIYTDAGYEYVE